jgi:uncharacterized protein
VRRFSSVSVPLVLGGTAIIALEVGRRLFRSSRLFNPTKDPVKSWNPADYGIAPEQCEEVWIVTRDRERLHGWYLRAKNPIASALYCHGNTGNLTNVAHLMPHLLDNGFNILLWDYRGYGRSSGRASIGGVILDTIAAAKLHDAMRPQHLPSFLFGFSLGGAIAAQVMRRHPFHALILQSTFTNLADIARVTWPKLPLHLISGTPFNTVRALRDLKTPLLILHGSQDEACPCWMAERMFEACASPVKMIYRVDGGLHKDLWDRDASGMVAALHQFASAVT